MTTNEQRKNLLEPNFSGHIEAVDGGPGLDEGPVEEVPVVGHEDVGLDVENVVEEPLQQLVLVRFVEHDKGTCRVADSLIYVFMYRLIIQNIYSR